MNDGPKITNDGDKIMNVGVKIMNDRVKIVNGGDPIMNGRDPIMKETTNCCVLGVPGAESLTSTGESCEKTRDFGMMIACVSCETAGVAICCCAGGL